MANKTSFPLSEAKDTITQIIRSMQDYPENDLIIIVNTILLSTLQAIAQLGTKLPKELQWCKNLPRPPRSHLTSYSTVDNTTQRHPTADDTTQQHLAADDTTQRHPTADDSTQQHSTADDTTQQHSAADYAIQEPTAVSSPKGAHPIKKGTLAQRKKKTVYRDIRNDFIAQSSSFPDWEKNPESFWKSAQELNITEEKDTSRFRSFIRHSLVLEQNADVPTFQRRFNSVIAFRIFSHFITTGRVSQVNTKKFLTLIGAADDNIKRCQQLLVCGRRRQELCQHLTQNNSKTDYGPLFLNVREKM